jgi:hypothetical protein
MPGPTMHMAEIITACRRVPGEILILVIFRPAPRAGPIPARPMTCFALRDAPGTAVALALRFATMCGMIRQRKPDGDFVMRVLIVSAAALLLGAAALAAPAAPAETPLAPQDIKTTFFTGTPFTSASGSIKYKMTYNPDGKMMREPIGAGGSKGEGSWKLSNDGFCSTWKGSKASCFRVLAAGDNKWSVRKGTGIAATWTK